MGLLWFSVTQDADESRTESFYGDIFFQVGGSYSFPGTLGPGFFFDELENTNLFVIANGAKSQAKSGRGFAFAVSGIDDEHKNEYKLTGLYLQAER